jgi:hypothetical protein
MKINTYIALILFIVLSSCSRTREKGGSAPGQPTVTDIESTPGGAIIGYDLPDDPDLLYVLARCVENGLTREFKASLYENAIRIEGLRGDTEVEVRLTAVNRKEEACEPLTLNIQPLMSSLLKAFLSLEGKAAFGGINLSYANPNEVPLTLEVLYADDEGNLKELQTFHSSRPSPVFSLRGFEAEKRTFKVCLLDDRGNRSDTAAFTIVPKKEILLNKSLFRSLTLKGDADPTNWGGDMRYIWDDRAVGDAEGSSGLHTGNEADEEPRCITFDIGVEATLSRFKLWCIQDDKHMYRDVSPKRYEIWGRKERIRPGDDGQFEPHWFKMGTAENRKPSDLPSGSFSEEDKTAAKEGDEIVFEEGKYTARYIRIRCLESWSGDTNMCFSEVSLWASHIKK